MGIGFAIPINMAKNIYLQLAEHGKVTRGRIGVYIQDLTRELAESFEIDQRQGILVSQVMEGSAAEKGGLKQGDVILKLNGATVDNVAAFRNQVALTRPGTTIELEILRQGKVRKHKIVVDTMEVETAASAPAPAAEAGTDVLPQIGLRLQKLTPELAEQFGYQHNRGVLVAAVEPGSVAARAGIEAGALIEEVNRVDVNDPKEVVSLVEKSKRDTVLLLVRQGSGSRYIALRYR
jgi:serine protease Do